MQSNNRQITIQFAVYFVANQTTIRGVAKHFRVSKTYVHKVLSKMDEYDFKYDGNRRLAKAVRDLLDKNKSERHIRGGNATKLKYMKKSKVNRRR